MLARIISRTNVSLMREKVSLSPALYVGNSKKGRAEKRGSSFVERVLFRGENPGPGV